MGRSVSRPSDAVVWFYTSFNSSNEFEYEDLIENLRYGLIGKFKSLEECNKWIGNENLIIAQNELINVGISTYFGIACIWVTSRYTYPNLESKIIDAVGNYIRDNYETLIKQGTMSNGVSVYNYKKR